MSCHEALYQHRWLFNWPSGRDCLYYCVCYLWIITNYTLLSPQWSVICLIWLAYSELKDALLTGARQLTPSSALWAAWLACLAYLRQFWERSVNWQRTYFGQMLAVNALGFHVTDICNNVYQPECMEVCPHTDRRIDFTNYVWNFVRPHTDRQTDLINYVWNFVCITDRSTKPVCMELCIQTDGLT